MGVKNIIWILITTVVFYSCNKQCKGKGYRYPYISELTLEADGISYDATVDTWNNHVIFKDSVPYGTTRVTISYIRTSVDTFTNIRMWDTLEVDRITYITVFVKECYVGNARAYPIIIHSKQNKQGTMD